MKLLFHFQRLSYEEFIDYNTGEIKQGVEYIKSLNRTTLKYADHSEYEGNLGISI